MDAGRGAGKRSVLAVLQVVLGRRHHALPIDQPRKKGPRRTGGGDPRVDVVALRGRAHHGRLGPREGSSGRGEESERIRANQPRASHNPFTSVPRPGITGAGDCDRGLNRAVATSIARHPKRAMGSPHQRRCGQRAINTSRATGSASFRIIYRLPAKARLLPHAAGHASGIAHCWQNAGRAVAPIGGDRCHGRGFRGIPYRQDCESVRALEFEEYQDGIVRILVSASVVTTRGPRRCRTSLSAEAHGWHDRAALSAPGSAPVHSSYLRVAGPFF